MTTVAAREVLGHHRAHRPRREWTALGLAALAVVVVGPLGVIGHVRAGLPGEAVFLVLTLVIPAVGGLIALRDPSNAVGWILLTAGIAIVIGTVLEAGQVVGFEGAQPSPVLAWLEELSFVLGLPLPLALILFPDGRPPSPRWRPLVSGAWVLIGIVGVADLFGAWDADQYHGLANPVGVPAMRDAARVVFAVGYPALLAVSVAALVALVVRFRRGDRVERAQVKWVMFAAVSGISVLVVAAVIDTVADIPKVVDQSLPAVLVLGVPAAIAVAILRYRLFAIDVIVNRTVVYVVVAGVLVAAYAAVVAALTTVVTGFADWVPSLAAAGAMALAFHPLRQHAQRLADRRLFGARSDPYTVVSQVRQSLPATPSSVDLAGHAAVAIATALRLPYVAVEIDGKVLAVHGERDERPVERFPLTYGDLTTGWLAVARRSPHEAFSESERCLLGELAEQSAMAIHAAVLAADVQRARERLVAAIEDERRRLRRDLHDGLGARLTGITFALEAARSEERRERADALLREANADIQAAIADLRRLVHDLRPPALDELGLEDSIRAHARTLAHAGLSVDLHVVGPTGGLPASHEVALHRIALEALTNAARHANATSCMVHLVVGDRETSVVVRDDGRGFDRLTPTTGIGLASLRERAEELGGRCDITTSPGAGTTVAVCIPLPAP